MSVSHSSLPAVKKKKMLQRKHLSGAMQCVLTVKKNVSGHGSYKDQMQLCNCNLTRVA